MFLYTLFMRPSVGVLVILKYNGFVLLGKRKGSHGHGEWSFPGGHLEFNETPEYCAKRELLEETGIDISHLNLVDMGYTNDIFYNESKHYITLYYLCELNDFIQPELKEPNKCFEWKWAEIESLPQPQFLCVTNYLEKNQNI